MIKQKIYSNSEVTLLESEPLSVQRLSLLCDEIRDEMSCYRPEFANLVRLQRNVGCRVNELFDAERWEILSSYMIKIQPQKGNAARIINLADIGFENSAQFAATLADIGRLPKRQYDRAFAAIVLNKNLWRVYEEGFAHPSTHLFRHVKIKELAAIGYDKATIATWIGEKNVDNLDYYLNSLFYT